VIFSCRIFGQDISPLTSADPLVSSGGLGGEKENGSRPQIFKEAAEAKDDF
jgi:hypothetical protein